MKRLIILFTALVVLGILAWKLYGNHSSTTAKKELVDFPISDTASVNRIFIAKPSGETIDLKRAGDHWTVNDDYKAKQYNVNLLLKTFNRVEARGPVPASTRETVIKNMSAKGVKVEIYTGDAVPEKTWIVGTSTQNHQGTYMLLETAKDGRSSAPYIMGMAGFRGYLTPRFHTILADWRDSELIAIPELNDITSYRVINHLQPKEGFTIELNNGTFGLKDAQGNSVQRLDTAAVSATLLPLRKLHYEFYEDFYNKEQRDSVMKSTPMYEVSITLKDGQTLEHPFWKRKPPSATFDADGEELPIDPDRIFSRSKYGELVVIQRHLLDRALPYFNDLWY